MDEARDVGIARGDGDVHDDLAAVDGDAFDEAEGNDVAAETWVTDLSEGGADVGFGGHGGIDKEERFSFVRWMRKASGKEALRFGWR